MEVLGLDEYGSDGLHSCQAFAQTLMLIVFFFWFIALESHLCAQGEGRRKDGQVWAPGIWGLSNGDRPHSSSYRLYLTLSPGLNNCESGISRLHLSHRIIFPSAKLENGLGLSVL